MNKQEQGKFPVVQSGRGQTVSAGKARKVRYWQKLSLCQGPEVGCHLESFLCGSAV